MKTSLPSAIVSWVTLGGDFCTKIPLSRVVAEQDKADIIRIRFS
jgi:hypothetical protein